jgi:hypothetical protein
VENDDKIACILPSHLNKSIWKEKIVIKPFIFHGIVTHPHLKDNSSLKNCGLGLGSPKIKARLLKARHLGRQ